MKVWLDFYVQSSTLYTSMCHLIAALLHSLSSPFCCFISVECLEDKQSTIVPFLSFGAVYDEYWLYCKC